MKNKFTLTAAAFLFALTSSLLHAQTSPVLWGVTHGGGTDSAGTIFSINGDGSAFNKVVDLNATTQGSSPDYVQLLLAGNGKFYGTTVQGGTYGEGTLFSLDPSTGSYTALHIFNDTTGMFPYGGVIQATDGKIYGMTSAGGTNNYGIIFSFDPGNNSFSNLFNLDSATGASPYGSLFQAANGRIYGLTAAGGASDNGVLFSFDPVSKTYHDLYDFSYATGSTPFGSLIQTTDGTLYGMTSVGGASNFFGNIFSFDTANNTYTDLFDFNDTLNMGVTPYGNLTAGPNNLLYGMTAYGGTDYKGTIFSFEPVAKTYTTMLSFNDSIGFIPHGNLALADNGSFYGLTAFGGLDSLGTIFRFNPLTSDYKIIFNFDSLSGFIPFGSLTVNGSVATAIQQLNTATDAINIQLFPNPSSGTTFLQVSDNAIGNTITVTDITGRQVMNLKANALINQLHTENLPGGVYNISLCTDKYSTTKTFVKN